MLIGWRGTYIRHSPNVFQRLQKSPRRTTFQFADCASRRLSAAMSEYLQATRCTNLPSGLSVALASRKNARVLGRCSSVQREMTKSRLSGGNGQGELAFMQVRILDGLCRSSSADMSAAMHLFDLENRPAPISKPMPLQAAASVSCSRYRSLFLDNDLPSLSDNLLLTSKKARMRLDCISDDEDWQPATATDGNKEWISSQNFVLKSKR